MAELADVQHVTGQDGRVLVRVSGELDAASVPRVRDRLDEALAAAGATALVLDLSPVQFMDSAGVELLFRLRETLTTRGLRLTLVVPAGAPVRRTLEVSDGGERLLEIVDTPPPVA